MTMCVHILPYMHGLYTHIKHTHASMHRSHIHTGRLHIHLSQPDSKPNLCVCHRFTEQCLETLSFHSLWSALRCHFTCLCHWFVNYFGVGPGGFEKRVWGSCHRRSLECSIVHKKCTAVLMSETALSSEHIIRGERSSCWEITPFADNSGKCILGWAQGFSMLAYDPAPRWWAKDVAQGLSPRLTFDK